ncbi:MAG: hypothetical protein ABI663_16225 [Chryseolinea sp.]
MKKVGRGFTIGGPILVIAGIILASSADNLHEDLDIVLRQMGGTLLIIGGIGITITGIILWPKGAKKYKNYLEKQGATTSLQWKGNRLSLTYRF